MPTDAPRRTAWREVPADAGPARELPGAAALLWVALAGPTVRAWSAPLGQPALVVLVGVLASVALVRLPARWWPARLAIAAAAGAVVHDVEGVLVAGWLTVGLLLGAWVAYGRSPLPRPRAPGPGTTAPVIALCGVAAWQGSRPMSTWQPAIPFALACAVPLLSRLGGGRLERIASRIGQVVADALAAILFSVLGAALILGAWPGRRLSLGPGTSRRGAWELRERRDVQPERVWAPGPVPEERSVVQRMALPVTLLAVGVLVVGGLRWWRSQDVTSVRDAALLPDRASAGSPDWYEEYQEDIAWVMDERVGFRPFEVYRLQDVETRHVDIRDGYRRSWTPPGCGGCPSAVVWLYGGSGAFGFEQRDDHTIASELARLAALEGVRLEVHNRGIPGQLHWRAALRFGWDLTVDPEPDLVVFYNGAEELAAAEALEEQGLGDVRAPYEPFLEDLYDEVHDVTGPLPPPGDVEFLGWPKVREVHGDAPRLAVVRYDRSRGISRNLAAAADVPVMYVWQPGGADRGPDHAAVSRLLPRDVVDLADLFDGADVRFVDGFDLTERGAHRVAEQLYPLVREHLEPALRRPGGGR